VVEAKEPEEKMDEDATDEATPLLSSADAPGASATTPGDASRKPAVGSAGAKKAESSSSTTETTLANMSRVTPAQAAVVGFPTGATYLPIRADAVGASSSSSSTAAAAAAAAGGRLGGRATTAGILMVAPNEAVAEPAAAVEFIELEASLDAVGPAVVPAAAPAAEPATGGDVDMAGGRANATAANDDDDDDDDAPERDPPAPFEYPFN
jgi:26S proteasome regulatory subunit N2